MTASEIKDKILGRENFWVATENERKAVCRLASALDIDYRTEVDHRGGFKAYRPPTVRKPTTKQNT